MNYYNEHDKFAAAWLRELIRQGCIPAGDVDERSIEDVRPNELSGYTQCHFFAGIGGWSYALDLAGWPRDMPVWTGSCPCQSFSTAGKGLGFADQRHLWPAWFHLIRECRPHVVFGEQVSAAIRHGWLDLVSADMEAEGYAVGAAVLGAHSVGAPHIRQRLYFVADSMSAGRTEWRAGARSGQAAWSGGADSVADAASELRREARRDSAGPEKRDGVGGIHRASVGDAINPRSQGHGRPVHINDAARREGAQRHGAASGFWDGGEWRIGSDAKARLIEPGIEPLDHGIPARMVRLRGYGNAICPQTAAAFIGAWLEASRELRAA